MDGSDNQIDGLQMDGSQMDGSNLELNKSQKTKGNYFFPNFLGKLMSKVGQRVQYESSLISITLILITILIATVITIFFTEFSLFIKIMAGIDGFAAFIFLSSNLITTFQQYQAYLSIMGILDKT